MNKKLESIEKFCIKKELEFCASGVSNETCYITKNSEINTYPEIRISNHSRFGVFEEDFIKLNDYSILELKEILARIFNVELDKRDITLLNAKKEKAKISEKKAKLEVIESELTTQKVEQVQQILCGNYDFAKKAIGKNSDKTRKWINLSTENNVLSLEIYSEDIVLTIKNYCHKILGNDIDFTTFENRLFELCKSRNIAI